MIARHLQYAAASFLLVLTCAAPLRSQESASAPIKIENPWARATPKGSKTAAIYLTLANGGTGADRLLSAATPVAEQVQFHMNMNDNGVMRMRELSAIDVPPGAKYALKPGATHAMLVGLKQQLKEGQTFPLTLTFEKAGKIDVTVAVGKFGAIEHHDMSNMNR